MGSGRDAADDVVVVSLLAAKDAEITAVRDENMAPRNENTTLLTRLTELEGLVAAPHAQLGRDSSNSGEPRRRTRHSPRNPLRRAPYGQVRVSRRVSSRCTQCHPASDRSPRRHDHPHATGLRPMRRRPGRRGDLRCLPPPGVRHPSTPTSAVCHRTPGAVTHLPRVRHHHRSQRTGRRVWPGPVRTRPDGSGSVADLCAFPAGTPRAAGAQRVAGVRGVSWVGRRAACPGRPATPPRRVLRHRGHRRRSVGLPIVGPGLGRTPARGHGRHRHPPRVRAGPAITNTRTGRRHPGLDASAPLHHAAPGHPRGSRRPARRPHQRHRLPGIRAPRATSAGTTQCQHRRGSLDPRDLPCFIRDPPRVVAAATTTGPGHRRGTLRRDPPTEGLGRAVAVAPHWATERQTNPALHTVLPGHTDAVIAVACTVVDGTPVAVTGSADETVRVWDLGTGVLHATLIGHTGTVEAWPARSWTAPRRGHRQRRQDGAGMEPGEQP